MPSADPVSSFANCYCRPILTQYTASSSRNAQLSQLDLVLVCLVTIMKCLVTLDAGLPAVVSLMTSTPCSLSQT